MGRIAIELRNDLDPNAVENFRSLCTSVKEADANGKQIVYKGTMTDELQQLHMVPKGHIIIINDETNRTCIYRSQFDDIENLTAHGPAKKFKCGDVEMMNVGQSNQVMLGKVLKNLDCLQEMGNLASNEPFPLVVS